MNRDVHPDSLRAWEISRRTRRQRFASAIYTTWSWVASIALFILALHVLYAAYTGNESLWRDVRDVVHAVLTSDEPVSGPMVPCATENSPGPCYWDANLHGNGEGRSFTVDHNNNVTYWED